MNKNSTKSGVCLIAFLCFLFASNATQAQTSPKLKFSKPQLYAGVAGQVGATYLFPDVVSDVDAYITIESLVNGAYLVNIDDSTLGYYNAWQPTVGGNGQYGRSYIKWGIQFKDKLGSDYQFSTLDASAIDTDGDNVRVREFVGVNGQAAFTLPIQVPSLLTISNSPVLDIPSIINPASLDLFALGPVANRAGIDTSSQDVRLNFNFTNTSSFKMYTGSQVDSNGTTGAIATDRYHCIYFQNISGLFSVLPVTYQSFSAVLNQAKVSLFWSMNSEMMNDHFEVERSFDQVNFSTAGYVLGAGSVSNGASNFSFDDKDGQAMQHQVIYYRLKHVNNNGNYNYSSVKMVRTATEVASRTSVQVMPNPYMDKLNVKFVSDTDGKVEIRLINASGAIVKKVASNLNKGANTLQLQDLYSQRPGMYVVNVVVNGVSVDSQKLIKK